MSRSATSAESTPTALDGLLRERGIARVIVCGLATDYCVNATALDAIALGYETFFLEDGVAAADGTGDLIGDREKPLGQVVVGA